VKFPKAPSAPLSRPVDTTPSAGARRMAYFARAIRTLEQRLSRVIESGSRRGVALDELISELIRIRADEQRLYGEMLEFQEQRTNGFETRERLAEMERHYVWVYRRVHQELCFFQKWRLELMLGAIVSTDALTVYHDIIDLEDAEKKFLVQDDAEVRRMLKDGDSPFGPGREPPHPRTPRHPRAV
jgi:hypothetical protein